MTDEPVDTQDEPAVPKKPRARGLRGVAERYPQVVIVLSIFGMLAGLIALQKCT